MKKNIIIILLAVVVASCAPKKNDDEKNAAIAKQKAQLEKLISQRTQLDKEIIELEEQLAKAGVEVKVTEVNVAIMEIQPTEFKNFIEVQGKVDGEENTEVVTQMPGMVTGIFVKEGDHVKKGQVLAELDSKVMKQNLEQIKTQLEFATNLYNKQKNLWEKNIGSEIQYLTAKNNKESLENNLATLKDQIALSKFISSINGTVESIPFKIGQMVSPGMPGSAIRVVNMSGIKVQADIAEAYAAKVKTGNDVLVAFPDFGKEFQSKVSFASRYIDPTNRAFRVEARLAGSGIEFRANMIAHLKINDYTNKEAMVVPVNIIQKSVTSQFVMVAEQGEKGIVAHKRDVTVGYIYNGQAEITAGLKAGDKIITAGYNNLKDGAIIKL
jgi:RND family efflux transporter MFP subunit